MCSCIFFQLKRHFRGNAAHLQHVLPTPSLCWNHSQWVTVAVPDRWSGFRKKRESGFGLEGRIKNLRGLSLSWASIYQSGCNGRCLISQVMWQRQEQVHVMGMLNNRPFSPLALWVSLVPTLNPHPPTLTHHSSSGMNSSTTSLNPLITFNL